MKIALPGQPNCAKNTIINHNAGYKAIISNFPGTTVHPRLFWNYSLNEFMWIGVK